MNKDYAIYIVAAVLLTPIAIIVAYIVVRYVAIIIGVLWTAFKSLKEKE